jgi:hypothetical protein
MSRRNPPPMRRALTEGLYQRQRRKRLGLRDYLLSRRRIDSVRGCWEWTGGRDSNGYGAVEFESRKVRVHRLAFTLWRGPIPQGLNVLHSCDTPPCFNPAHLFPGTDAVNSADMVKKNRQAKGEGLPQSKLTAAAVLRIRTRYAAGGITMTALAREFGISLGTIQDVLKGHRYAHVPGALNLTDRRKDRQARGERVPCHKLTEAAVVAIRARFAEGEVTKAALGRQFGVGRTTIHKVLAGRQWAHVS